MKRKLLALALAVGVSASLSACRTTKTADEYPEGGMMTIIDKGTKYDIKYEIYVHDETGVMYLGVDGYNGGCSICVMLDEEGNPLIYRGKGQR